MTRQPAGRRGRGHEDRAHRHRHERHARAHRRLGGRRRVRRCRRAARRASRASCSTPRRGCRWPGAKLRVGAVDGTSNLVTDGDGKWRIAAVSPSANNQPGPVTRHIEVDGHWLKDNLKATATCGVPMVLEDRMTPVHTVHLAGRLRVGQPDPQDPRKIVATAAVAPGTTFSVSNASTEADRRGAGRQRWSFRRRRAAVAGEQAGDLHRAGRCPWLLADEPVGAGGGRRPAHGRRPDRGQVHGAGHHRAHRRRSRPARARRARRLVRRRQVDDVWSRRHVPPRRRRHARREQHGNGRLDLRHPAHRSSRPVASRRPTSRSPPAATWSPPTSSCAGPRSRHHRSPTSGRSPAR